MTKQETIKVCLVDEKPVFWPDVGKLKIRSGMVGIKDYDLVGCTVTVLHDGGYTDSYYVYYSELHPTEYDAMIAMADKIDALVVLREKRLAKLHRKAIEFRAAALTSLVARE